MLVAALDWGLGHATRSVPLIRQLQSEGHEVILASTGTAADFYRSYFPELKLLDKPGYGIKYYNGLPFSLSVFLQIPKIMFAIFREHRWLKKVIEIEKIKSIISDNCYGLWHKNVYTTFITHQLSIVCPPSINFLEPLLRIIIALFVKKFDECHVPDFASEENLSGKLSHFNPLPGNVRYIGPLSRFSQKQSYTSAEKYDVVLMLSGPEPQRSLFEKKCIRILEGKPIKACILRGKPGDHEKSEKKNIILFNHVNDERLIAILENARKIICRSGYSTIMDLHALNLTALLVPTPGQTEQEYLASFHKSKGRFEMQSQESLKYEDFIGSAELYQA